MQPMQQTHANKPKYATGGRAGWTNAGRRAGGTSALAIFSMVHLHSKKSSIGYMGCLFSISCQHFCWSAQKFLQFAWFLTKQDLGVETVNQEGNISNKRIIPV